MENNRLSPELMEHFRRQLLKDKVSITADLLEGEIEDSLWRMLSRFEEEVNKEFKDQFAININYSNISVNVEAVTKSKDKASKEIEDVLKELNRIYKGQYKFDYTEEK